MERSGAGRCGEYGRTPGCAPAWWSRCAAGPQPARVIAEQSCEPACSELARRAKAGGGLTPPAGVPPPHPYAGGCTGTDGCEHDRCEAGPAAPIPDAVGGCDATGRPPIVAAQYDSFGTKYCWPCAPERGEGVGARGWGRGGRGCGGGGGRGGARGVEGSGERREPARAGESGGGRRERDQRPPRVYTSREKGECGGGSAGGRRRERGRHLHGVAGSDAGALPRLPRQRRRRARGAPQNGPGGSGRAPPAAEGETPPEAGARQRPE